MQSLRFWAALAVVAVIALNSFTHAKYLVPTSTLTPALLRAYADVAAEKSLAELAPRDAYSAFSILRSTGKPIAQSDAEALCTRALKFAQGKSRNHNVEFAYYYQLLHKTLKCGNSPLPYAKNEKLVSKIKTSVQSESLPDVYYGTLTVLESEGGLAPEDFDIADAALLAADVINPDGTGRISIASLTSSIGNAGLAYEVLGRVAQHRIREGALDSDPELREKLQAAVDKLKNSFAFVEKSTPEANPVTNRGLAALLKGAAAIAESVEQALPMTSESVFAVFARAMDQADTITLDNAKATLDIVAAASGSNAQWSMFAIVPSSYAPIGSKDLPSAAGLSYSCVTLQGQPIKGSKLEVISISRGVPGKHGSALGIKSLSGLDSEAAGHYTAILRADLSSAEARSQLSVSSAINRVSFTSFIDPIERLIKRLGTVTSATINAFVSQKEFGTSGSSAETKLKYPAPLSSAIAVNVATDKYFRMIVDVTASDGAVVYPTASLISSLAPEEVRRVTLAFSAGSGAGNYISSVAIPQELAPLPSGRYTLQIHFSGKHLKTETWQVADLVVTNPSPKPAPVLGGLPEPKAHTYPKPEGRPFAIVSLIYAVICAAPLVVLVKHLVENRTSVPLLPGEGVTRMIFMGTIAGLALGLNLIYWVKLNIFQAFMVIAVVALPAALAVRNALVYVRQRKGLETEALTAAKESKSNEDDAAAKDKKRKQK